MTTTAEPREVRVRNLKAHQEGWPELSDAESSFSRRESPTVPFPRHDVLPDMVTQYTTHKTLFIFPEVSSFSVSAQPPAKCP